MSTKLGIGSVVLMNDNVDSPLYGDGVVLRPAPPTVNVLVEHIPGTRGEIVKNLGVGAMRVNVRGRWLTRDYYALMNTMISAIGITGVIIINNQATNNKLFTLIGINQIDTKWSPANEAFFIEMELQFIEVTQ